MEILPLFCEIDDFCKVFEKVYERRALSDGKRRRRATRLSQSEVMTILVMYHASGLQESEGSLPARNTSPAQFGVSRLVQLSKICSIAVALCHAIVFLSVSETRQLHGHFIY
jgi:hypothetical protein